MQTRNWETSQRTRREWLQNHLSEATLHLWPLSPLCLHQVKPGESGKLDPWLERARITEKPWGGQWRGKVTSKWWLLLSLMKPVRTPLWKKVHKLITGLSLGEKEYRVRVRVLRLDSRSNWGHPKTPLRTKWIHSWVITNEETWETKGAHEWDYYQCFSWHLPMSFIMTSTQTLAHEGHTKLIWVMIETFHCIILRTGQMALLQEDENMHFNHFSADGKCGNDIHLDIGMTT